MSEGVGRISGVIVWGRGSWRGTRAEDKSGERDSQWFQCLGLAPLPFLSFYPMARCVGRVMGEKQMECKCCRFALVGEQDSEAWKRQGRLTGGRASIAEQG